MQPVAFDPEVIFPNTDLEQTLNNANVIIVLENGGIVEQGTHQELLAAKRYYYELFLKQMNELLKIITTCR